MGYFYNRKLTKNPNGPIKRVKQPTSYRFVCFYCLVTMPRGSGRTFLDELDEQRWVHDRHPVRAGEREVPDGVA